MKGVKRYLIQTKDYGIFLLAGGFKQEAELVAWSDADWARGQHKWRSRTGYLVTISGGPVICSSRLQTTTALSTPEAEFNALAQTVREIKWVRSTLQELGIPQTEQTVLNEDNLGAIDWTKEVQSFRRVKHVAIKYHFGRDSVDNGEVAICYTSSATDRADSLARVLVQDTFAQQSLWLGCIIRSRPDAH